MFDGEVTDSIALRGLRVHGRHGVHQAERDNGQDFIVDAILHLDLAAAAASDDITNTVHYAELADRLVEVVAGEPVNLLETLAGRLADVCLADSRVVSCEVTVHKPQAPIHHEFADVSVTVRR